MTPFFLAPAVSAPVSPRSAKAAGEDVARRASPASFLNPVTTAAQVAAGIVAGPALAVAPVLENAIGSLWGETKHVGRRTIEVGGQAVATALTPPSIAVSDASRAVSSAAGFLASAVSTAAEEANSIAKKVLIGEAIFAGVAILGIGAALWIASTKGGDRVTKILLGKASDA